MLHLTWLALAIVAILLGYLWHRSYDGEKNESNSPPHLSNLSTIRHLFDLSTGNVKYLTQLKDTLGDVFMVRVFNSKMVFLSSGEAIRDAFVNHADAFADKLQATETEICDFEKYGILFENGAVWKEKRRFTAHYLRKFGAQKTDMETIILDKLKRLFVVMDKYDGQKMAMKHVTYKTTFSIILEILFGDLCDNEDKVNSLCKIVFDRTKYKAMSSTVSYFAMLKYIPGDPFKHGILLKCMAIYYAFLKVEVDDHWRTLRDGEPRDYVDAFLMEMKSRAGTHLTNENGCYTERELVSGIQDMLNGASDTTSTTMDWALLYMAVWPEIQQKVQRELDDVIGRNRSPIFSDMPMLPYVKATMLEIQRLNTVVGVCTPRKASQETTILNYTIPKDSIVLQLLYAAHRDKNTFRDPDVFRPERFLDGDKTSTPNNFLPFAVGPRSCLGEALARMELFLLFSGLMHRYSFSCATGEPLPSIEPDFNIVIEPKPFQLVIKIRET